MLNNLPTDPTALSEAEILEKRILWSKKWIKGNDIATAVILILLGLDIALAVLLNKYRSETESILGEFSTGFGIIQLMSILLLAMGSNIPYDAAEKERKNLLKLIELQGKIEKTDS